MRSWAYHWDGRNCKLYLSSALEEQPDRMNLALLGSAVLQEEQMEWEVVCDTSSLCSLSLWLLRTPAGRHVFLKVEAMSQIMIPKDVAWSQDSGKACCTFWVVHNVKIPKGTALHLDYAGANSRPQIGQKLPEHICRTVHLTLHKLYPRKFFPGL